MSNIQIAYDAGDDPRVVLERMIRQYGNDHAFILIPRTLWRRLTGRTLNDGGAGQILPLAQTVDRGGRKSRAPINPVEKILVKP